MSLENTWSGTGYRTPQVEQNRFVRDFSNNTSTWEMGKPRPTTGTPELPPSTPPAPTPPPPAPTQAPMQQQQAQSSSSSSTSNEWSPRANSLWDVLWGRSQQTLTPNAKDPVIAGQVGAFGATQERGARNYINEMAERMGPTANIQGERRMASENAAQATGGLQAQLMQNELNARRAEIQAALGQMGGMLSDQERRALEDKLGSGQLALQGELGRGNLAINQGQLGLQAADRANYWDAVRSGLFG